jgi:hypothetical protein
MSIHRRAESVTQRLFARIRQSLAAGRRRTVADRPPGTDVPVSRALSRLGARGANTRNDGRAKEEMLTATPGLLWLIARVIVSMSKSFQWNSQKLFVILPVLHRHETTVS